MNEYNEDLSRARRYLQLDPDEMENVKAEQRKWEARRNAAKAYGDSGSLEPCESLHFAPLPCCVSCDDSLTADNRSGIHGLCIVCLTQHNAKAATLQAERQPLPTAQWWTVAKVCAVILIVVPPAVWLLASAIWRMAGGQ